MHEIYRELALMASEVRAFLIRLDLELGHQNGSDGNGGDGSDLSGKRWLEEGTHRCRGGRQ